MKNQQGRSLGIVPAPDTNLNSHLNTIETPAVSALKSIIACAKVVGPHGISLYAISDERMAAAKSAIHAR
jgi:hypothetical protein